MNTRIKIKVYWERVFEIDDKIINNADSIDFSEDINSGQSGINIDLLIDFSSDEYHIWDMIEYSIYNDDYKNGLLKFSWIITKIQRKYDGINQSVRLDCQSITYLLTQVEVDKVYSWTYQSIVDDIIADLWDNTCNMNFLWNTIFKNEIQDTWEADDLEIDGSLFQAIQKLFEEKQFFINQYGEIRDTFEKKHLLKFGRDIISNNTTEDIDGISDVELEVQNIQDINVWDTIKIVNTDTFLNLDGETITKLDFNILQINIIIWEIKNLKIG